MTTDQLKKQAREHEHREEWGKALGLYAKVLERGEESGEPEIALYNRVADLQVRTGDIADAVENYDRAIDLYLEADLPNNAIAICRKVLRNVPGRAETFLRMGQIRASQGFGVDARQHVLTYAELMQSRGDEDAATGALEELVDLFPEDAESRVFLGERLVALGSPEKGIPHLVGAWQVLDRQGSEEADALAGRIRELDPGVDLASAPAETGPDDRGLDGDDNELAAFLGTSAGPMEHLLDEAEVDEADGDPFEFSVEDEGEEGPEPGAIEDPGAIAPAPDVEFTTLELPGVEIRIDEGEGAPGTPGHEDASPDPARSTAGEESAADPLDLDPSASEFTFGEIEIGGATDLDSGDADQDADQDADLPPLPLLGVDEGPEDGGFDALDDPDSTASLEAALASEPERLDLHGMLVERAQDEGDRALLLRALRGLAGALERAGNQDEAGQTWEQVLQLDPRDAGALAALGREDPASIAGAGGAGEPGSSPLNPPPAPGGQGNGGGFVDLGALVLDDEEAPTTRWVVDDERSGDEDVDFAGMLSKFKAKVAQHITRDDARASYDLGTAYREMGLLDEAIGMFQQALRAQPGHLASLEMLGQCFLDRDEPHVAVRVLERALAHGTAVEDDFLGIYYFLGVSHERAGNRDEAREFYEKVFSLDINFKDVTDRLRELR
jgi:tetratricopeptide (TPR) repeat protein